MFVREIGNDFVVSTRTRITLADPGAKWCDEENRAMISWEDFSRATKNY